MNLRKLSLSPLALIVLFASLSSASAFANWTALTYNPTTGSWGRAQCESSYDQAANLALQQCGEGCKVVAYAKDGFVALAVGADSHFGTGNLHGDQATADQSSLQRCSQVTTDCTIRVEGSAFNCR